MLVLAPPVTLCRADAPRSRSEGHALAASSCRYPMPRRAHASRPTEPSAQARCARSAIAAQAIRERDKRRMDHCLRWSHHRAQGRNVNPARYVPVSVLLPASARGRARTWSSAPTAGWGGSRAGSPGHRLRRPVGPSDSRRTRPQELAQEGTRCWRPPWCRRPEALSRHSISFAEKRNYRSEKRPPRGESWRPRMLAGSGTL